jgi:hypothetical protein
MKNDVSLNGQVRKILNNPSPIQYLKVVKDLTFKDYGSRRTSLSAGEFGYILDEEKIFLLPGASAERKSKMIADLMECCDQGSVYALVCGYQCVLMPSDYEILDYIPNRCCGELI